VSLVSANLITHVHWTARDSEESRQFFGYFRIATRDVGATIGVGVYAIPGGLGGEKLVHSFYAHTRHPDWAEEITRDLILETVREIQEDRGARFVVDYFPERFPARAAEAGHAPLPEEWLTNGRPEDDVI
jgi:hypothetical protein